MQTFETEVTADVLTAAEKVRLKQLEAIINEYLFGFRQVAAALIEIHDNRLYRALAPSFTEYINRYFGPSLGRDFSRMRMWQIMQAERTIQAIEAASVNNCLHLDAPEVVANLPLPTAEGQTRPMNSLPIEERPAVWALAVESAGGGVPTGKQVAATVAALSPAASTSERIGRLDTDKAAKVPTPAPTADKRPVFGKGFEVSGFRYDPNAKRFHFSVFKPANTFKGWPAKTENLQVKLDDLDWELRRCGFCLNVLDAEQRKKEGLHTWAEDDTDAAGSGEESQEAPPVSEAVTEMLGGFFAEYPQ